MNDERNDYVRWPTNLTLIAFTNYVRFCMVYFTVYNIICRIISQRRRCGYLYTLHRSSPTTTWPCWFCCCSKTSRCLSSWSRNWTAKVWQHADLPCFLVYSQYTYGRKHAKSNSCLFFSVLKAWAYFLVLLYTSINTTHRLGPGKLVTVLTCKANFFSSTKSLVVLKIPPFCEFCGFYMLPLALCINCGSFPPVSI